MSTRKTSNNNSSSVGSGAVSPRSGINHTATQAISLDDVQPYPDVQKASPYNLKSLGDSLGISRSNSVTSSIHSDVARRSTPKSSNGLDLNLGSGSNGYETKRPSTADVARQLYEGRSGNKKEKKVYDTKVRKESSASAEKNDTVCSVCENIVHGVRANELVNGIFTCRRCVKKSKPVVDRDSHLDRVTAAPIPSFKKAIAKDADPGQTVPALAKNNAIARKSNRSLSPRSREIKDKVRASEAELSVNAEIKSLEEHRERIISTYDEVRSGGSMRNDFMLDLHRLKQHANRVEMFAHTEFSSMDLMALYDVTDMLVSLVKSASLTRARE